MTDSTQIHYTKAAVIAACNRQIVDLEKQMPDLEKADIDAQALYDKTNRETEEREAERLANEAAWKERNSWKWFPGPNPFAIDSPAWAERHRELYERRWGTFMNGAPMKRADIAKRDIEELREFIKIAQKSTGTMLLSEHKARKIFA